MVSFGHITDLAGPGAALLIANEGGLNEVPGGFLLSLLLAVGGLVWLYNQIMEAKRKHVPSEAAQVTAQVELDKVWAQLKEERNVHRTANANIHTRVNQVGQKVDQMDGKLDGLKDQVGVLLKRALKNQ